MVQKIGEKVIVTALFNPLKKFPLPKTLIWKNRKYDIKKFGLYHNYKIGTSLFHVFSVSGDTLHFKLILDSTNLKWTLEEIYDSRIR